MEEKELFMLGAGLVAILVSAAGLAVGFFGFLSVLLAVIVIYHATTFLYRPSFRVGNFANYYKPPTTRWCTKIEYEEVWVPPDFDAALERLYERIIDEFLVSWYKDLSPDPEFIQEIRTLLRDVTSEVITRLAKVDLTELILYDVIPSATQHVDTFLWARHHCPKKDEESFHSYFVGLVGKQMHVSLSNREAEVEYLEDLSERLFPLLLKRRGYQNSRLTSSLAVSLLSRTVFLNLFDTLCSPRIVNKLLWLAFSPADPNAHYPSSQEAPVKLLFRFVHAHPSETTSFLRVDLSHILDNQDILVRFVQFLKRRGGVNLVDFCLAVEDFKKKLLVVDLPPHELIKLQAEARRLFVTYFRPKPVGYSGPGAAIRFDPDIVKEIESITNSSDPKDVEKLRTTPPLYRAYHQVFNNLEDNYCPHFHLSHEYLSMCLGPRLSEMRAQQNQKNTGHTRSSSSGRLSRLKQEVLGQAVEGTKDHSATPDPAVDMLSSIEQDTKADNIDDDRETRDLTAWRVAIPHIEPRYEGGKACFVFIIQVQRIDVTSSRDGKDLEWTVGRQQHEFYILQSALEQYHGVFDDIKLPPRSKFRGKGLDVLQAKREPFQDFLVKLLQKSSLKKSDLLFTFLTSLAPFEDAVASQLGLSRIIKSVPIKLTKERGQYLQGFVKSYSGSSLAPVVRSAESLWDEPDQKLDDCQTLFKDNLSHLFPFSANRLEPSQSRPVDGLYDVILFLSTRVFKLRDSFVRLLYSVKCLLEGTLNHLIHYAIAFKLDQVLTSSRVAYVVNIVEESLFSPPSPEMPEEEQRYHAELTLQAFRSFLPSALESLAGQPQYNQGTQVLFDILQDPFLNKHLVYSLLDVLVTRLFPELKSHTTSTSAGDSTSRH